MKKKILYLLLLAIFLSFVTGCKGPDGNNAETTQPAENDQLLTIVENKQTNFIIIFPEDADQKVVNAAMNIRSAIGTYTTNKPKYATDFPKNYNKDNYEILVGRTNYDETSSAMESLAYGDYIIKIDGNKIVIAGWENNAIAAGCDAFIKLIKSVKDDDGNIALPKDFRVVEEHNKEVNNLKANDIRGSYASVSDTGDQCYLLSIKDVNKDTYEQYVKKLKEGGYQTYAENQIKENSFVTFTTEKNVVNVIYSQYNSTLRIITEPLKYTALPDLSADNQYNKVTDSLVISVGLAPDSETKKTNGMCYVFRLADGSFIIYDGGWDSGEYADRLYNVLKTYAPDPNNIVISAWLFTHPHTDHIGAFKPFTSAYKDRVKVERFIYNMPNDDTMSSFNILDRVSGFYLSVDKYSGAKVIKAHPGQKFYIKNAELEILFTLDLYDKEVLDEVNTSSVISKLTIDGQTFLMLGDMSTSSNSIVRKMYEDYLKSDFVQVAHHGAEGGSTSFYNFVKPSYVLWPASTVLFEETKSNDRNPISSMKEIM